MFRSQGTTSAITPQARHIDDDRHLLARISRWRRTDPTGAGRAYWPKRWEPSYWSGWWRTFDGLTQVCWAEDREPSDTLVITWQASRYDTPREARVPVLSLRQAVDVLVALEILPREFSSAYEPAEDGPRNFYGVISTRVRMGRP